MTEEQTPVEDINDFMRKRRIDLIGMPQLNINYMSLKGFKNLSDSSLE